MVILCSFIPNIRKRTQCFIESPKNFRIHGLYTCSFKDYVKFIFQFDIELECIVEKINNWNTCHVMNVDTDSIISITIDGQCSGCVLFCSCYHRTRTGFFVQVYYNAITPVIVIALFF